MLLHLPVKRKTMSVREETEKTIFTLCLGQPDQSFISLVSVRVVGISKMLVTCSCDFMSSAESIQQHGYTSCLLRHRFSFETSASCYGNCHRVDADKVTLPNWMMFPGERIYLSVWEWKEKKKQLLLIINSHKMSQSNVEHANFLFNQVFKSDHTGIKGADSKLSVKL